MNSYEIIKYIERISRNEIVFDDKGMENMSDGEMRDIACLCTDGKYIRSKNNVIPLYEKRNFYGGMFLGFGVDEGWSGFRPSSERPLLEVTSVGKTLLQDYMKEQQSNSSISVGNGSTLIVGNVTDSKISSKKQIWKWCGRNKVCIGSLALNLYFILRTIF